MITPSHPCTGQAKLRSDLSPGAFTLIELLVVIAIIGLLAGILLPVLTKAKAKARSLQCVSRQKSWATALHLYEAENNGWMPREGYEPFGEVTWNNWTQVRGRVTGRGTRDSDDIWYNALPRLLDERPASDFAAPRRHADFYERSNPIHCPSAKFPGQAYSPIEQIAYFSLAMNSHLIQYPFVPTVKFSQIEQADPVRMVVFLDNLLEGERKVHERQASDNLGQPSSYANRFSARHSKGGNLAFADGHVDWYAGPQVVETREHSPLVGGPILPGDEILWELEPFR